ncbi:hypothetical protein DYI81_02965 [Acinetobacter sp. SWAC5]|uniref:PDDEXK-like family protein n=1 Tax=Acinetobacter sp. SWAC5 TaxID=2293835 RepID=UPI000E353E19|nr:PD-(D/E)XK nuclease family protein [Acinetobacter sp. SWAC5]RFS34479.1 hypothetical protein DYI81_02965 [Acinetobacter sp. SWAC5]
MQNIEHLLRSVSDELRALALAKSKYVQQLAPNFSIFNYIYTDELMLSRMIADLLDPKGDHAQGHIFLSLFLQQLTNASHYLLLDIQRAKVAIEVLTFRNQTKRRMDIYLEIPYIDSAQSFGICIENKPYAADQKNQLKDYASELSKRHDRNQDMQHHWHLVYLAGYGNEPSAESVEPSQLEEWKSKNHFTLISYPELIEWLNQCMLRCQNERVNNFLNAFNTFIRKSFLGIQDMSEQQHLLNLISSNDQYMASAFEIIKYQNELQDQLIKKFESQLIQTCKQKNWHITGHFSREKATGLTINFDNPHTHIDFIIQFYAKNYGDFFWGLSKKISDYHDPDLWKEIHQNASLHFSTDKIQHSEWWPFYIDQKYPFNWQSHHEAWPMILSGELCDRVMYYAEETYQLLKKQDLLSKL